MRPQDAVDLLKSRGSQKGQFAVPQVYLDDAENIPKSGIRIYNTDDQFIINIKDLVGAQDRINKSHSAQEYIGLKLKKIEEALRNLKTAEITPATTKVIGELVGIEKDAFVGPLLRGAASLVSRAVSPVAGAVAKSAPMRSLGTLGKGVTKTYQNVVPAGARKAIGTAVDVGSHPGTQVALAGGSFMKDNL
jgi:bifunctional DNA-binding transcriptional regulator/antitoxin component of YhaV-PrlF toxin-antitoxin module